MSSSSMAFRMADEVPGSALAGLSTFDGQVRRHFML